MLSAEKIIVMYVIVVISLLNVEAMVAAYPDVGPDSLSEDAIHKEVIVTHSS